MCFIFSPYIDQLIHSTPLGQSNWFTHLPGRGSWLLLLAQMNDRRNATAIASRLFLSTQRSTSLSACILFCGRYLFFQNMFFVYLQQTHKKYICEWWGRHMTHMRQENLHQIRLWKDGRTISAVRANFAFSWRFLKSLSNTWRSHQHKGREYTAHTRLTAIYRRIRYGDDPC